MAFSDATGGSFTLGDLAGHAADWVEPIGQSYRGYVLHEIPPDSSIPWDITQERPGYHLRAEISFKKVKPAEYAGLFISGGRAPEYLRDDEAFLVRIERLREQHPELRGIHVEVDVFAQRFVDRTLS